MSPAPQISPAELAKWAEEDRATDQASVSGGLGWDLHAAVPPGKGGRALFSGFKSLALPFPVFYIRSLITGQSQKSGFLVLYLIFFEA